MRNILVHDIGGHRAKAALVSPTSKSVSRLTICTYPRVKRNAAIYKGSVTGSERIACGLRLLKRLYTSDIKCIAIASTGIVNMESGCILRETSPTYQGTNWPDVLRQSGIVDRRARVLVVNDAWCGAWWEFKDVRGALGRNVSVRVTVGSGMGSGIVIDGSLFRGTSWVAGELAYVPFRPQDGVDCPLGRGCVEAYASASGVIREFSSVATSLQSDWYKALLVRGNITLRDVKLAHKRGEPSAAEAIQTCGEALGTAIGIVLNLLGPTTIAIGGSVVELIPALFDTAKKAASIIGLPVAIAGCEIRQANWKDLDAVLLGAAALAATDARTLASYEIARD